MKPDGTIPDGLVASLSTLPPEQTMDRLAAAVGRRGMTVLARIDHAGAARAAGLDLRATEVLVFGNPKGGTPLMQSAQTAGIDLPLKALVWQDAEGRTWVGYNDPGWIAVRHGIADAPETIAAMLAALAAVVSEATKDEHPKSAVFTRLCGPAGQ